MTAFTSLPITLSRRFLIALSFAVGAVLTPLVVPKLSELYGWRPTFVIVASLGILWVFGWIAMVRGPDRGLFAGRSIVDLRLARKSTSL